MPGPILHAGASATCPHGGTLTFTPKSPRVTMSGAPVMVLTDQAPVVGCAFTAGNKPQPCISTTWTAGATRVVSLGSPVLVNPSGGVCQSAEQIPGGPPVISGSQTRVVAT
ncbi:hypothetical protein HP550_20340 [Cellulomonas humilata]|uniref:PAAR motif-containing protein n=1 Tax=Cellulomonas humilata TaxID=144055 RepID=A0A7Y6DZL1_9CELL|nr:hypothetical protein [Cellulomonas humilata]NUU19600.1 hypothetical protein [Cellulomonas humilata]